MQDSLPSIRLHKPEEGSAAQELIMELSGEPSGGAVSRHRLGMLQSCLMASDSLEKAFSRAGVHKPSIERNNC